MALPPRNRPHLHVEGGGQNEPYTSPRIVITGLPPARARAAHAALLKHAVDQAIVQARTQIAAREAGVAEGAPGFYLQFDIPAGHQSAIDSLENKPKAIELVAVRPPAEGDATISATVFVPESAADFYDRRIEAYRTERNKSGKPKNENLIARIDDVRLGAARALLTDDLALFPAAGVPAWWEVWLRDGRLQAFQTVSGRLALHLAIDPRDDALDGRRRSHAAGARHQVFYNVSRAAEARCWGGVEKVSLRHPNKSNCFRDINSSICARMILAALRISSDR
jgi:hypothetical protein